MEILPDSNKNSRSCRHSRKYVAAESQLLFRKQRRFEWVYPQYLFKVMP